LELINQYQIKQNNRKFKSPQSTQSFAIPATAYETALQSRRGTRMTQIGRIFTDILYYHASLFPTLDNKPQRSQRTQSRIGKLCAIRVLSGVLTLFETWLTRIYTYLCVSASSVQSVFHCPPPILICVHPRLIFAEDLKPSGDISPQSTQRSQRSSIPVATYEKATASRFRTRMTRIARIFTDIYNPRSIAILLRFEV